MPTLIAGRILGGLSTSLLFSAFESWMVSEHRKRGFSEELLSSTFAISSWGNGVMAIFAGILAQVASGNRHNFKNMKHVALTLLLPHTVATISRTTSSLTLLFTLCSAVFTLHRLCRRHRTVSAGHPADNAVPPAHPLLGRELRLLREEQGRLQGRGSGRHRLLHLRQRRGDRKIPRHSAAGAGTGGVRGRDLHIRYKVLSHTPSDWVY